MSALSRTAESSSQSSNNSITSISTNARIDYILRFSKHAVLVVDDNADIYTKIAGQYVGSLSEKHNASLLTISSRHNDIQIRCRIIEQLYGNVLFDPEQPLAVSILNFAKNNDEPISVVIEEAQKLSVQLFHELCQLVEMAKKAGLILNVLMVGHIDAGSIVAQNKLLFKGKLSILSATSGQLISHNHPIFKKQGWINYAKVGYALLGLSLTVLLTVLGALGLNQYKVIDLEKVWDSFSEQAKEEHVKENILDEQFVLPAKTKANVNSAVNKPENTMSSAINSNVEKASQEWLFEILNTQVYFKQEKIAAQIKQDASNKAFLNATQETLKLESSAITIATPITPSSAITEIRVEKGAKVEAPEAKGEKIVINNTPTEKSSPVFDVQPNYYLNENQGVVIQISGFTTHKAYQEYISAYPELKYFTYLKRVNNTEMMIMTSPIYETRVMAEAAIKSLPLAIQNSGIWIKSIEDVQNEIKSYDTISVL